MYETAPFIELRPKIDMDITGLIRLAAQHDWNDPGLSRPLEPSFLGTSAVVLPGLNAYTKKTYRLSGPKDQILINHTMPVLDWVLREIYPDHTIMRAEVGCTPPRYQQGQHYEPRVFHRFAHRLHVPLITDASCYLEIEGVRYHLPVGQVSVFNDLLYHHGCNPSAGIKVHIVADFMPTEWFDHMVSCRGLAELYAVTDVLITDPQRVLLEIHDREPIEQQLRSLGTQLPELRTRGQWL